jgi:Heterokaryon incompatibility protein (HET)
MQEGGRDDRMLFQSVKTIKTWMNRCAHEHGRKCTNGDRKSSDFRPSRVLEVRRIAGGENIAIRLRLQEDLAQLPDLHYATLSHCWGKSKHLVLKQSLLSQFREDIPLPDLPKTFQDAAILMALLDISYLWIDSLCIVQDSKADWTKEAHLMSRVYGEAYLNVTATASKSDEEGIFDREKSLHSRPTCLLDLSGPEISSKRCVCYNATPWQQYVQASPWKERAWTFQEALLAPRTIHFARGLLLWECAEERTAENMPGQISESRFVPREGNDRLVKQALFDDGRELREETDRRIINSVEVSSEHLWEDIVFQYTHGALSYPSDKLVAITGVARKFCSARHLNPCTYLAGLWKEMLPANLLWRGEAHLNLFGGLRGRQRTQMYRAPSWSWAGINDGPISHPVRRKWEIWPIDVLDAYVISDDDPMGAVRGGSIKLKGKLFKAMMYAPLYKPKNALPVQFEEFGCWDDDSDEGVDCYGAFIVPRVHSDSSETERRVAYLISSLDDTRNHDSAIWRSCIKDPPDDLQVWEDHFFLPVLMTRVRGASDPELVGEVILGLDLTPSGRKGEFFRIGTFEIRASSSPAFVDALGCRSVPAENYEDFDGVDRYTISII